MADTKSNSITQFLKKPERIKKVVRGVFILIYIRIDIRVMSCLHDSLVVSTSCVAYFGLYQSKKSATYCHVGKHLTALDSLLNLCFQAPSSVIDGANFSRQFV